MEIGAGYSSISIGEKADNHFSAFSASDRPNRVREREKENSRTYTLTTCDPTEFYEFEYAMFICGATCWTV